MKGYEMKVSQPEGNSPKSTVRTVLKWTLTGLPLIGVIGASFFPLQAWEQQSLVLVTLLWFMVFFLLDTLFLGK